jgi:plasmid stabilization system protein ParE
MDYKVVYKDTFLTDLEHLLKSIAQHDPAAAQKVGNAILRTSESLSSFPERFPRVRERPELRRFIQREYLKIFYRVIHESKTVEILRIWDGRRSDNPTI